MVLTCELFLTLLIAVDSTSPKYFCTLARVIREKAARLLDLMSPLVIVYFWQEATNVVNEIGHHLSLLHLVVVHYSTKMRFYPSTEMLFCSTLQY